MTSVRHEFTEAEFVGRLLKVDFTLLPPAEGLDGGRLCTELHNGAVLMWEQRDVTVCLCEYSLFASCKTGVMW